MNLTLFNMAQVNRVQQPNSASGEMAYLGETCKQLHWPQQQDMLDLIEGMTAEVEM